MAIYAIGLDVPQRAVEAAQSPGAAGRARPAAAPSSSPRRASSTRVYGMVEAELRSQYLLAYQSPAADANRYREVDLRVARPGTEVKTIQGYFP